MHEVFPWLVVFDLDGTLIDSSLDLCLSVNAALVHVGRAQLQHSLITSYVGDGAATLIQRALRQGQPCGVSSESSEEEQELFECAFPFFLEFYRHHKLDHTRLYDGVMSSLATLRELAPDLPMAVLTNKPVRPSVEICAALGIAPFFFAIYGGNSFATKKPDPAGLLALVAEGKGLASSHGRRSGTFDLMDVLLIGDSATDVLTARRAGVRCLGCRYGLAPESLEVEVPDLFCNDAAEWPDLLRKMD